MKLFLILLFTITCANLCNPVFAQFGSTTIKQIDQIKNNNGTDIILDPTDKVMINYFTGGFALQSTVTGELQESSITNTELSYLSGASSNIQDQLDVKEDLLPWMDDGDLVYYDLGSATALAIGTNGQILTVSGGLPTWQNAPISTTLTAKGDIQTHNGTANATLTVGTNGQILKANSATATGLEWVNDTSSSIFSDAFLTLNDGNDQANADGTGGLLITMTDATDVALNYDSGVASQFVIGEIGDQHEVITAGHTQSLVDKTIDLSSIVNPVSIEVKLGTQAQLETHAASAVSGELAYATDTKAYYGFTDNALVDLGGGSGGGFNYIENPTPKIDTSGWVRYKTTAPSATPDDFAGVPNGAVTWTRNTTNALNNVSDFLLTKDANNRQGEGIYYEFDIRNGDKTVMQLLRALKLDSANYTDADISLFLVTSSDGFVTQNIIYPANQDLLAGTPDTLKQFQFNSTDTEGRLCIHISSTNALAYTVQFNDFALAQSPVATSAVVLDWEEFTPTGTWIANTTYTGFYRRVGDSAEIFVRVALAGAPTSATLQVNLPSGLALDTTKLADSQELGTAWISDSSTPINRTKGSVSDTGSNSLQIFYIGGSTVTQAAPFTFASGDEVVLRAIVPIQGWSSNAASSIDLGAREIHASGNNPITTTGVIRFTEVRDTTSSYDSATGIFTAPESGLYQIESTAEADSADLRYQLVINGAPVAWSRANVSGVTATVALSVNLVKGDAVGFNAALGTVDTSLNYSSTFSIHKVASPQTILAAQAVYGNYTKTDAQSIGNGGSHTTIVWSSTVETTNDNWMNTSTGELTIGENGNYQFNSGAGITSATVGTGTINMEIYKNGTRVSRGPVIGIADANAGNTVSHSMYCNKDDVITVRIFHSNGTSRNLSTTAGVNTFSYHRTN